MKIKKPVTPTASRAAFVSWLQKKHPAFYAQVRQSSGLGDLGTAATGSSTSNIFSKILDSATGLLSQYVTSKEQLAQLKLNIARAKAGQMPLTGSEIQPGPAAPGVFGSIPTWVLVAGGGAVLYLLLKR